jgi:hypothetical protein
MSEQGGGQTCRKVNPFRRGQERLFSCWLEEMAAEGWILESISGRFAKFRRETRPFRYGYIPIGIDEGSLMTQEDQKAYREKGWTYIDSMGGLYLLAAYEETEEELQLTPSWYTDTQKVNRAGITGTMAVVVLYVFNAVKTFISERTIHLIDLVIMVPCLVSCILYVSIQGKLLKYEALLNEARNPRLLPEYEQAKKLGVLFWRIRLIVLVLLTAALIFLIASEMNPAFYG